MENGGKLLGVGGHALWKLFFKFLITISGLGFMGNGLRYCNYDTERTKTAKLKSRSQT